MNRAAAHRFGGDYNIHHITMEDDTWVPPGMESVINEFYSDEITKHAGPGAHPSGSPQTAHAGDPPNFRMARDHSHSISTGADEAKAKAKAIIERIRKLPLALQRDAVRNELRALRGKGFSGHQEARIIRRELAFLAKRLDEEIAKHGGPGNHPSGSSQDVHGSWARGLSARQRIEDVESEGGFTVHVPTGVKPTTGYAVALPGHEERRPLSKLTASWVQSYRRRHAEALADPKTSWGAWYDKKSGDVFFDISIVEKSKRKAQQLGRKFKQLAIWDFNTMSEIRLAKRARNLYNRLMSTKTTPAIAKHTAPLSIAKHPGVGGSPDHQTGDPSQQAHGGGASTPQRPEWMDRVGLPDLPPGATHWIDSTRLASVQEKVETLNRKAERHGLEPFTVTITDATHQWTERRQVFDPAIQTATGANMPLRDMEGNPIYSEQKHEWTAIKIEGHPPMLPGWEFVARIEHLPNLTDDDSLDEYMNVFSTRPDWQASGGAAIPKKYREASPFNCDVCNRNIYRKDTFLVHNTDTGEWKQVGRDDLKLFTGHNNPAIGAEYLKAWERIEDEIADDGFDQGGGGDAWDRGVIGSTDAYLALSAAVIEETGYLSKTKIENEMHGTGTPTSEVVRAVIGQKRAGETPFPITDAHRELAKEAQAFYAGYQTPPEVEKLNEFLTQATTDFRASGHPGERAFDLEYSVASINDLFPPTMGEDSFNESYWGYTKHDLTTGSEDHIKTVTAEYERHRDWWIANVKDTDLDPSKGRSEIQHDPDLGIDVITTPGLSHRSMLKAVRDLSKLQYDDEFMLDMQAAVSQPYVTTRTAGKVTYAIPGYQRELSRRATEEALAVDPGHSSEWVGEVGERREWKSMKVVGVKTGENNYGTWHLTRMISTDGDRFATWYKGNGLYREETYMTPGGYEQTRRKLWGSGDSVTFKGTIKDHAWGEVEDEGHKVTWLTNLRNVEYE